jgi:hypothetical protein
MPEEKKKPVMIGNDMNQVIYAKAPEDKKDKKEVKKKTSDE